MVAQLQKDTAARKAAKAKAVKGKEQMQELVIPSSAQAQWYASHTTAIPDSYGGGKNIKVVTQLRG